MPKPELYVVYTGSRKSIPDTISLSEEFFDGADISINVKVKVICENRNILKDYLENREKEVVSIFLGLPIFPCSNTVAIFNFD